VKRRLAQLAAPFFSAKRPFVCTKPSIVCTKSPSANTPSIPFVCVNVLAHVMTATLSLPAAETDEASRLGALFDAHHQRLYRLARRLSATAEEARDLVQETFLRAARSPQSVPDGPGANAEAWLVRVLVNLQRDEWRRKATRRRLDPEGEGHAARAEPTDVESAFIAKTTVWRALEQLDPRRRAAIVMYELEGVAIPAIAASLGVSAVTVRWHLSRGRKELAGIIQGEGLKAEG
jgi:RNA polymerase sigma-70 factor (ECF subfamily)